MRNAIAATLVVVAGLVLANMLGVAAAEAPTTATPVQSVSVQGVATAPIGQYAKLAEATAAYRDGMAAAVSDGQSKAEFLVGKAGATLGSVQSIVEDGGSIGCTGDEEGSYGSYEGEQPDFGSADGASQVRELTVAPETAAARPKPAVKRRKKHATAKKASAPVCTLSAQVSLVYGLN
jgi:Protein of unknown function (DUF541)